jgi:RNA polymerase sigma factor (sigma-70 family)
MEASRAGPKLRLLRRRVDLAFERLYNEHAGEVYQYALALLSNPTDAEDVTQTTFLNAYRALQRGERPLKPHNWLIKIAHNVCRMRWRQAGSRPREVALDHAPEPIAHDQEQLDLDEVLTALAALTFNQRAALVMRELEGRTYQEIAEVLGLSVSAVEALLFRARRRLQINRKSLGVITSVPLPGSLVSLVGGGGGAVAVGGTAVVLKAAAVVAAGAVTAGVGYKGVEIVSASARTSAPAHYVPKQHRSRTPDARPAVKPVRNRVTPRWTPPTHHAAPVVAKARSAAPQPAQAAAPAAQAATPAALAAPIAPAATPAASPVAATTSVLPKLPPAPLPTLPPPPPVPVQTPSVPPPPVAVLPKVPSAPLPPLPQVPPVPPLPPSIP